MFKAQTRSDVTHWCVGGFFWSQRRQCFGREGGAGEVILIGSDWWLRLVCVCIDEDLTLVTETINSLENCLLRPVVVLDQF